jgi:hypothetical protein
MQTNCLMDIKTENNIYIYIYIYIKGREQVLPQKTLERRLRKENILVYVYVTSDHSNNMNSNGRKEIKQKHFQEILGRKSFL